MEKYIVKIKSYYNNNIVAQGNGIIVAKNLILTAKHIINGDKITVEIEGLEIFAKEKKSINDVSILEIEKDIFWKANIFADNEVLDEDSKWKIQGYIGEQQKEHNILGYGFFKESSSSEWDYSLINIIAGAVANYKGLSGAPVFCNDRIVGILQVQIQNEKGNLGLRISSINMFKDLLPDESKGKNKYLNELYKTLTEYTEAQIEKNIKNKKYISEIFVEEGLFKENARCFVDPILFVNKTIKEIMQIDFSEFNKILPKENIINFSGLELLSEIDNINIVVEDLIKKILKDVNFIESLYKDENDLELNLIEFYNKWIILYNNSIISEMRTWLNILEYSTKKYLLLTKNAGQGKTNFLCDVTSNFLLKKNYLVLYYNAYDLNGNPIDYILNQLTINGQYSETYINKVLLHEWKRTKHSIIVIIDGLNENTSIENFDQCIENFLMKCEEYPYIKVIMSTRNELFEEKFGIIEKGIYCKNYIRMNMDTEENAFKERIFLGYMKYFDISIKFLSEKAYKLLSNDVLLLRFFCEVNIHQKQIYLYDVYKYEVFQQYIEIKTNEYCGNEVILNQKNKLNMLFNKIVKHMLEKGIFFCIPVEIFTEDEEKTLIKMLETDVIFKTEEVVKSGLLEKSVMMISFTFDEFRDFCITNYILENFSEIDKFMMFWQNMRDNNLIIREGVQKYIFYLSKTKYQKDLGKVIKKVEEYDELYWQYIWDIQDEYLSEEDIQKWKNHVLQHGKHEKKIITHLLLNYDYETFKKMNIKVLFEFMNEIIVDSIEYKRFIRNIFVGDPLKVNYYQDEEDEGLYKKLINCLLKNVKNREDNIRYKEYFKLTIYLLTLNYFDTLRLWKDLYRNSPDIVEKCLIEMKTHTSSLIQNNIKIILLKLQEDDNRRGI